MAINNISNNLIYQLINKNESWKTNYQEFLNDPPQDAGGFLRMTVQLQLMGNKIFSLAQIVRHQMEETRTIHNIDYLA